LEAKPVSFERRFSRYSSISSWTHIKFIKIDFNRKR